MIVLYFLITLACLAASVVEAETLMAGQVCYQV